MTTDVQASIADSGSERNSPKLEVDCLKFGLMFALAMTAAQKIIGLARGVLFCRLLPEEQLGQWSLTWSYLMLLAPLAVLGLPGSFNRYVEHYRQSGQLKAFLARTTAISIAMTVLFTCAILVFAESISEWLFRDRQQQRLVFVIALSLGLVAAFNFASSLVEALRQIRLVTWMRFLSGVSFAIIAIVLILYWNNAAEAVTAGFAASCLIGLAPAVWYLARNWNLIEVSNLPLAGSTLWSKIAPFAAWLWVINIVSNLYELADRCMLLHLAPVASKQAQALVGQYHSGRVIPLVLVGIAAMLGGILMSYMTAHWEKNEREKVASQLRWTLKLVGLGFTLTGALILLFAPFLFDYVLQGKFDDGLSVLPLTLVYCIWYSLIIVGQDYLWCREQGKWACAAVVFGLVVNVCLNALLIPVYGLSGAVYATAISNFLCLVVIYLLNCAFRVRPDKGVWVAAIAPLILLLPPPVALLFAVVLGWGGVHFHWIFDEQETREMVASLNGLNWEKLVNRMVRKKKTSV